MGGDAFELYGQEGTHKGVELVEDRSGRDNPHADVDVELGQELTVPAVLGLGVEQVSVEQVELRSELRVYLAFQELRVKVANVHLEAVIRDGRSNDKHQLVVVLPHSLEVFP